MPISPNNPSRRGDPRARPPPGHGASRTPPPTKFYHSAVCRGGRPCPPAKFAPSSTKKPCHCEASAHTARGERTERCQWQMKRGERVAAVKISSVRRKAAQKFWAPQQGHPFPSPSHHAKKRTPLGILFFTHLNRWRITSARSWRRLPPAPSSCSLHRPWTGLPSEWWESPQQPSWPQPGPGR